MNIVFRMTVASPVGDRGLLERIFLETDSVCETLVGSGHAPAFIVLADRTAFHSVTLAATDSDWASIHAVDDPESRNVENDLRIFGRGDESALFVLMGPEVRKSEVRLISSVVPKLVDFPDAAMILIRGNRIVRHPTEDRDSVRQRISENRRNGIVIARGGLFGRKR